MPTTLASPPLRMLLATDGSVTALLEACFEAPVEVRAVANTVDDRLPTPFELELEPGRPVLWRHSVLSAGERPLLRASAVIALDRLEAAACCALLAGDEPIGSILRGVEARRELLALRPGDATEADAAELDIDGPVFERVSRIVSSGHPVAVVIERIPASIFDSL
jgi:chorismate-pyruvate lyase